MSTWSQASQAKATNWAKSQAKRASIAKPSQVKTSQVKSSPAQQSPASLQTSQPANHSTS